MKRLFKFIVIVFGLLLTGLFYSLGEVEAETNISGYKSGTVYFKNSSTTKKEIGVNGLLVEVPKAESISYQALFKETNEGYQFFYYGNEAPYKDSFTKSKIISRNTTNLAIEIEIGSTSEEASLPLFYFVETSQDVVLDATGKLMFVAKQIATNDTLDYYTPNFQPLFIGEAGYTLNASSALVTDTNIQAVSLWADGLEIALTTRGLDLTKYLEEIEAYITSNEGTKEFSLKSEVSLWQTKSIVFKHNLTWDLAGKSLYFGPEVSECIYVEGADLTIVDSNGQGQIVATDTLDYYYGHLIELNKAAKLHLNGGTLYGKRYAIYTAGDSQVTINGSTIYAYTIIGADSGENTSSRYLYFLSGNLKSYGSFVFVMSNKVQKLYIVFGSCNYESYNQDFAYLDTALEIENVLVTFTGNPTYIYVRPNKPYSIRHSYFNIVDENYQGDQIAIDGFGFKPVVGDTYLYKGLESQQDFYKNYQYINSQDESLKDTYMFGLDPTTERKLVLCEAVDATYVYDSKLNPDSLVGMFPSKLPLGGKIYLPEVSYFVSEGKLYELLGFYTDSNYENEITAITLTAGEVNPIYIKTNLVEISVTGLLEAAYGETDYEVTKLPIENLTYTWYVNGVAVASGNSDVTLKTGTAGSAMVVYVEISGIIAGKEFVITSEPVTTEVLKADIDISAMHWCDTENFIYSGESYIVYLENVPAELEVTYIDNEAIDAGGYVTFAEFTYDEENYNPVNDIGIIWEILPKELLVKIADQNLDYNANLLNYELSYEGFVNGEDEKLIMGTFIYDTTYQVGAKVGNYYLYGKGLAAKNYEISYVPGILTVNKILAPELVVDKITVVYGEEVSLDSISLPYGVTLVAGQELLEGENTYAAIYNPDPINYEDREITIVITATTPISPLIFGGVLLGFGVLLVLLYISFGKKKKKNSKIPINFYRH